jgi:hypothetical protein
LEQFFDLPDLRLVVRSPSHFELTLEFAASAFICAIEILRP